MKLPAIIRACQLEIGDEFRKQSVVHIVVRVEGRHWACRHKSDSATGSKVSGKGGATISIFSEERVELLSRKIISNL